MYIENPHDAARLLADPTTPAETLAAIASSHRDFWTAVSLHPNAYPELIEWMRQQGFTSAPLPAHPTSAVHAPAPRAQAKLQKSRKTWLLIGAAAVAVAVAATAVGVSLFLRPDKKELVDSLSLVRGIDPAEEFCFTAVDLKHQLGPTDPAVEAAAGEDKLGMSPFFADCGDPLYGLSFIDVLGGEATMLAQRGSKLDFSLAIDGDFSEAGLSNQLRQQPGGVWGDQAERFQYTLADGVVYANEAGSEPPGPPASRADSLAVHPAASQLMEALVEKEPFFVTVGKSHGLTAQPLMQDVAVTGFGSAVSEQDSVMTMTIAFAHETDADARTLADRLEGILERLSAGSSSPVFTVEHHGKVVLLNYPNPSTDLTQVFWALLAEQ
ncbi:hypothetical protein ACI1US_02352 [Leucobacter sp. BZR 635]